MKKIIVLISILLALAGVNTLKAQCWSQPFVSWDGICVYPDDETEYVVNLTIWNECTTPYQKVFDHSDIVSTNITNYTFCLQNELCTNDHKDPCFKMIYTVGKRNIDTHEIICFKQLTQYVNCEKLHYPDPVELLLE